MTEIKCVIPDGDCCAIYDKDGAFKFRCPLLVLGTCHAFRAVIPSYAGKDNERLFQKCRGCMENGMVR